MHPEFIVSLDLGTTKVAAVVGEFGEGGMKITGAAVLPSDGVKKGMVVDMEAAAACVGLALEKAGRMAEVDIQGVCAGFSGPGVRSINSRGVISLPDGRREVTAADVRKVVDSAGNVVLPSDMEIVDTAVLDFTVDKSRGIKDPVGMAGSRLGVEVHLVTAQAAGVENFVRMLEKVGVDALNLVFQPLACAHSVLTREEMESGCLLIDIGGGITDFALFHGGCVRASGVIPVGGNNISKDLAIGLRIPESAAEEIKLRYGLALESLAGEDETVLLPGSQGNSGGEVRKKIIAAIMEPRCEEIFSMIKASVSSTDWYKSMGAGVVLTGGGSRLMGMKSVASQVFGLPARKGMPEGLGGIPGVAVDESWSAAVGLLLFESDRFGRLARLKRPGRPLGWMFDRLRRIASLFL